PEPVKKQSDWDRMVDGFIYSLKDVGEGIVNFFIGLVIALPYLAVWAVVIIIIVLIIKAIIKSIKKKREKKQSGEPAARRSRKDKKGADRNAAQTVWEPQQQLTLEGVKQETEDKPDDGSDKA
ncbi:MAG: hypothetical protein J5842_09300, partial [Lachnospiraceae bacterium]|nr:hypothetical protein [Lachnospiraceae bacterium]